jgi:hypothetical protein
MLMIADNQEVGLLPILLGSIAALFGQANTLSQTDFELRRRRTEETENNEYTVRKN